ncbi:MAG TPA: tail fiber protein [Thermoanaerobaculia bacterium]|jgi:microcystin-dependent protein
MADPFVAEIRMYPFNFAPMGWAFCDGQIMILSQNTALFSLLGTTYGGNGKSTFALPNLQGSVPLGPGQSKTGTLYDLGQVSGSSTVTLVVGEMPFHTHTLMGTVEDGTQGSLTSSVVLAGSKGGQLYQTNTSANLQPMNIMSLPFAGATQPHNNMMPYLTLNFCIALQGVFPARP